MPENRSLLGLLDDMAKGFFRGKLLCAAVRLQIADALGDRELSLTEIAGETGCKTEPLYRLLRALASIGIVVESKTARFHLSPLGQLLRRDVPNSAWAAIVFWADLLADSWTYLADCVRSGENAANVMEQQGVKSRWSACPDSVSIFHAFFAEATPETMSPFAGEYDFSRYRTVADLGGAGGALLCAILGKWPQLTGVLVDRKEAIENAVGKIDERGFSARCRTVVGDLLEAVPCEAEVFILQSVLHGYDDDGARRILENCRRVAGNQALLIIEIVLPAIIAQATPALEQMFLADINMLAVTGGRERSAPEWSKLVSSGGYEINRISPVPGHHASIIECLPRT